VTRSALVSPVGRLADDVQLTDPSDYRFVHFLQASPGPSVHLPWPRIADLIFESCNQYLTVGIGRNWAQTFSPDALPLVRDIRIGFRAEVVSGEDMFCGVRAIARTQRSFTAGGVLFRRSDGALLTTFRCVYVTTGPGGAVVVPDSLWDAIEQAEARNNDQTTNRPHESR